MTKRVIIDGLDADEADEILGAISEQFGLLGYAEEED